MEQATESVPHRPAKRDKRRRRGAVKPRVSVEEQVLKAEPPAGSHFKGYETYLVEDLVVRARVVRYRRERWVAPDGQCVIAPLPEGIAGAFRPGASCRFVLMQYHQGQHDAAAAGVALAGDRAFHFQAAGLATASPSGRTTLSTKPETFCGPVWRVQSWISVDDTGARHKAKNGYCTPDR